MAVCLYAGRMGPAIFALTAFLSLGVYGDEFVSKRYGFRFAIPAGFRQQSADVVNLIAEFAERNPAADGSSIKIDIQHTELFYNPAEKIDSSQLPRKEGWSLSVQARRWKDMELQVIRREIAADP